MENDLALGFEIKFCFDINFVFFILFHRFNFLFFIFLFFCFSHFLFLPRKEICVIVIVDCKKKVKAFSN